MTARIVQMVAVLALGLGIAGTASAGSSASHARKAEVVSVVAKDYSFTLSRHSVPAGRVTLDIRNEGRTRHDFEIDRHTSKIIGPGQTTTLTVTLKRGRYPYKCTVDSHAELGMKGVLRVT
jgi:uncharacterized cupredoxin-like copper-binding protein